MKASAQSVSVSICVETSRTRCSWSSAATTLTILRGDSEFSKDSKQSLSVNGKQCAGGMTISMSLLKTIICR